MKTRWTALVLVVGLAGATSASAMQQPAAPTPADGPAQAQPSPAPSLPPAPPRAVISNPDWMRMPTGAELASLYPRAAMAKHLGGHTRMSCRVQADGTLTSCVILSETPAGLGFGRAAIQTSRYFKMRPKTVDGQPVEGFYIDIPLDWTPPGR